MADLATLGVVVTTKGIKEAERNLDGLAKSGAQAEKGVGRIEPAMKGASRSVRLASQDIQRDAKRIGVALGAATLALTTGAAFAVKSAIDRADEISKAAQKIGVTTEALSRLEFAAKLSDVSLDQLQQGVNYFGRELDKNEPLLNRLGVSVRESSGEFLQANDIIRDLADVFASLPDGIEKGRLASELFGARVGADLLPLLNQGSKAIADLEAESDALGNTISTQTGRAAEEFNDTLTRTRTQLQGIFLEVGSNVLPKLQQFASDLNNPEFREGFATIIEGATLATIKVAELLSGIGSLTRFVSEELAARVGGPDAFDTVRVEQRIARLKETIDAVQGQGVFSPFSILDAKELVPADLVSSRDQILARLQSELDKEQNKLKLGIEFNAQDVGAVEEQAAKIASDEGDRLAALRAFYEEQAKASEQAAGARRAQSDAARAAAEVQRELQRIEEEGREALAGLNEQVNKNAADLAGPAAQAARAYADEMLNLVVVEEKLKAAGLFNPDAVRLLTLAREQTQASYDGQIKAINATSTAAQQLIKDLEFELRLMGLSNVEREKEIALRYAGAEATEAQKDEIRGLIEEIERSRNATAALDGFRGAFENSIASILDGSASAKDALKSFADTVLEQLSRIVAQSLTAQLFGDPGQNGGGLFGGGLFDLFGQFLGTGRAAGGPVVAGKAYPINERGQPEVLEMYGRKFLLPGGDGEVSPLREGAGSGDVNVSQVFNVQGRVDPRSAYQIQREAAMQLQRASGR